MKAKKGKASKEKPKDKKLKINGSFNDVLKAAVKGNPKSQKNFKKSKS